MSKATEQRIKQKLKDITRTTGIPFNTLLETLFLERFLARLANSTYRDRLIFKGGMCLANYIDLKRSTKDIDFLLSAMDGSKENVEAILSEVAAVDLTDEVTFIEINVTLLSLVHKKYPGYRIKFGGRLGKIRSKINIDIGVGDVVKPKIQNIYLLKAKEPLFEDSVSLLSYTPEYIFSEKLEAIIHHGEANGRMKDYFDCWQLILNEIISDAGLKEAIDDTSKNRGTKITLIPDYSTQHDHKWKTFIRRNDLDSIGIADVINTINRKLESLGFKQ